MGKQYSRMENINHSQLNKYQVTVHFDMDEELDELNINGNKLVATFMAKHNEQIADLLNLSSTLRRLERVGDYNTNIAEELFFYNEATVLKHKPKY